MSLCIPYWKDDDFWAASSVMLPSSSAGTPEVTSLAPRGGRHSPAGPGRKPYILDRSFSLGFSRSYWWERLRWIARGGSGSIKIYAAPSTICHERMRSP